MANATGRDVATRDRTEQVVVNNFFAVLKTRAKFKEDQTKVGELTGGMDFRASFHLCTDAEVAFLRNALSALHRAEADAREMEQEVDQKNLIAALLADRYVRQSFKELIGEKVASQAKVVKFPVPEGHWVCNYLSLLFAQLPPVMAEDLKANTEKVKTFTLQFLGRKGANGANGAALTNGSASATATPSAATSKDAAKKK